jgi:hypothetical protein
VIPPVHHANPSRFSTLKTLFNLHQGILMNSQGILIIFFIFS